MQFDFSALDFGHVQDIIDQGEEVCGRKCNFVQAVTHPAGFINMVLPKLHHPHNAVERSTDFMRHLRQEVAFRTAGCLRPFLFQPQQLIAAFLTSSKQKEKRYHSGEYNKKDPCAYSRHKLA